MTTVCLLIFLGMNLAPVMASNITVSSGMQNSDVQNLINNAKTGDTLNFKDGNYQNVSLTINKKLNIISTKNAVLNGNNSTGKSSFVFYFTNQSSGSVFSGFNINTNTNYAIILNNVKNINLNSNTINGGTTDSIYLKNSYNINMSKNTITNSEGNGVTIYSSSRVNLKNNQIINNMNGVSIKNSQNINLTQNNIKHNQLNGVTLESSKNILINANNINNNYGNGISLRDTDAINITSNNITYNTLNGLIMEGTTRNTCLSFNYLIHDLNGIFLDSISYNDSLISNFIIKSYISSETIYDAFYTGNGIKVGDNYQDTNSRINIYNNVIVNNKHFAIQGDANYDKFTVGPNYYNTNDKWNSGVCPMISTCMLNANVVQGKDGFTFSIFDPSNPSQTITQIIEYEMNVAVYVVNPDNSKTLVKNGTATVKNGKATFNMPVDKNKKYIFVTTIADQDQTYQPVSDNSIGDNGTNGSGTGGNGKSPTQGNGNSGGTGTDTNGNGGNTNSNSTGGLSNTTGNGKGDSGSGNSTSNGTLTGTGKDKTQIGVDGSNSNQGGQQSVGDKSGGSQNSVEVAIKNAINSAVNNPFNNLGIIALLGLIGIGYFKRDKFK